MRNFEYHKSFKSLYIAYKINSYYIYQFLKQSVSNKKYFTGMGRFVKSLPYAFFYTEKKKFTGSL